jgi:hypothetical protein
MGYFSPIPVRAFISDLYRRQYNPNFIEDEDDEEDYEGHWNLS